MQWFSGSDSEAQHQYLGQFFHVMNKQLAVRFVPPRTTYHNNLISQPQGTEFRPKAALKIVCTLF